MHACMCMTGVTLEGHQLLCAAPAVLSAGIFFHQLSPFRFIRAMLFVSSTAAAAC
jgi:hypothetical protein